MFNVLTRNLQSILSVLIRVTADVADEHGDWMCEHLMDTD
jgi:hypothetical protein